MATKLSQNQISNHHSSFVDPTGRLFRYEGQLYRGIYPEREAMVRKLLEAPRLQQAMANGELVETTIADLEVEGFSLVLLHREVSPVSYPHEWAAELLQASALVMLDLARAALDLDLVMSDANPWNVLPNPVRPTFVDFGSFKPAEEEGPLLWAAYDQFTRLVLYPLYLYAARHDRVVSALLRDHFAGVDAELCSRLLPTGKKLFSGQTLARLEVPRVLSGMVGKLNLEEKLKQAGQQAGQLTAAQLKKNRTRFLEGLRSDVARLKFSSRTSEWSDYTQGAESLVDRSQWTLKQTTIARLLEEHAPASVLDVACNKGWFSLLASDYSPRVVAFDTDAPSISQLTRRVLSEKKKVLPLVMNILNPSPSSGWRLQQFPSAVERYRSELVMALALIHHLVLSQMQDFARVVEVLSDFTSKWLLVEFVPLSDDRSQQILGQFRREQFGWYTVDNFAVELERRFQKVESFPSHPDGRTLFFCTL